MSLPEEAIIRLEESFKFLKEKAILIEQKVDKIIDRNQEADRNFSLMARDVRAHQVDDDREFREIKKRVTGVEATAQDYKDNKNKLKGAQWLGMIIVSALTALFTWLTTK